MCAEKPLCNQNMFEFALVCSLFCPFLSVGVTFGRNGLHENTHRLTKSDFDLISRFHHGGRDVISRHKVLPSGVWTRSVCQCRCWRLCSSVRQFLIYSAFVLFLTVFYW